MKKKKNAPELRFKGFVDDWEQRKLGDLSEIRRGSSPRPIQDPKWFDEKSKIGWLRISDVTEQNGRIRYVGQHISEEGQKKTLVLNEPHLILSIAATVGKPVINYIRTGIHDGFIVFINPRFDKEFMFQWLEMFRPKWQKYGQPGSQVNINSDLVRNQDILIPSLGEQIKIAKFFKQLDDTIALYQLKLDKLKELKRAYVSQIFEQRIRFSGFLGEWEQCKLGEHSVIKTGGTPKTGITEYWYPKEIPWMSSGEVNKKRLASTDSQISKKGLENSSARWVKEKSVLIALAGQGKTRGTVAINEIPLTTNQSIAAIEVDSSLDSEFVFQNLESRYEELRIVSSGDGTRGGLNKQLIADLNIVVPSVEEQREIGIFLKQLDITIALNQSKIDKFNKLKQGFLQKMFI